MKKIWLIITLAAIVGAIWYIEGTKAHPGAGGASQAINIATSSATISESLSAIAVADRKAGYKPAIEIADPTGFVNVSGTFKLSDLIGKKIILLDFWTYSCINCIRTLPYLTSWYQRYKDEGLVVVGVHTPEFDFEKDINNVQAAVKQYGIQYPVVLDSDYGTWTAYGNFYWPHEYLIDMAGYIVHDKIGEGDYGGTETEIQKLVQERDTVLGIAGSAMSTSTVSVPSSTIAGGPLSPETYFGAARNQYLANGVPSASGDQTLVAPQSESTNSLYLVGNWNFQSEYAANNAKGARIIYKYRAAKVYFVASAPNGATIEVFQDGRPVANVAGSDVKDGKALIRESRLYDLINNPDGSGEHTLEIIIDDPGLQAYTFTFG